MSVDRASVILCSNSSARYAQLVTAVESVRRQPRPAADHNHDLLKQIADEIRT